MQNETVTIGIVDDHPLFREGIILLLNQSSHQVVLQAYDGFSLQRELKINPLPDVLLLDIRMKGMDGYETLKWVNAAHPGLPVIILSECQTTITNVMLMFNGAASILNKSVNPEVLLKAINRVVEDGYYFPDTHTRNLWRELHQKKGAKPLNKHIFSEREWRLLKLAGTNLTYVQIGSLLGISVACVKKALHELYMDMDVQNRPELALVAERYGIVTPLIEETCAA